MNMQNNKPHICFDEVRQLAVRNFALELTKTELEMYKERKSWRDACKMTAYFQSTPEKAAFSRLMYVAARVNQSYTITEISQELDISRQTICRFTDDCCKEGWIVWQKVHGKSYKYKASDELCIAVEEYADYSSDLFQKTAVHDAEHFLGMLKRRQPELHRQTLD